jgi:hypothetical protein
MVRRDLAHTPCRHPYRTRSAQIGLCHTRSRRLNRFRRRGCCARPIARPLGADPSPTRNRTELGRERTRGGVAEGEASEGPNQIRRPRDTARLNGWKQSVTRVQTRALGEFLVYRVPRPLPRTREHDRPSVRPWRGVSFGARRRSVDHRDCSHPADRSPSRGCVVSIPGLANAYSQRPPGRFAPFSGPHLWYEPSSP